MALSLRIIHLTLADIWRPPWWRLSPSMDFGNGKVLSTDFGNGKVLSNRSWRLGHNTAPECDHELWQFKRAHYPAIGGKADKD
jgi:hypothetical protein